MQKNNSNPKGYQLVTTILLMSLLALAVLLFIRQASAHEAYYEHLDISISPSSALSYVNPDQQISLDVVYKYPCDYGRHLCTEYPRASSVQWGTDNENVSIWNNCEESGGDDCFSTHVQFPQSYPEWSSMTLTAYYRNVQQDITFTNSQFIYNNGSYQTPQYYNDDFDDDYYDTYYVNQMDQWEQVPIYDGGVRYVYRRPPIGWDPYTCGQFVPTLYGGLTYIPCALYPWELVLMRHGGWVRHPSYGWLVFYGARRFELDWSFHFGFSMNIFHLFHYNPFYDDYYRIGFHHERWRDRIFDHCGVALPRHSFMNKTIRNIRITDRRGDWPSRDFNHYKSVRDLTKGRMEEIVGGPFRAYSKKEVHSKLAEIVNFPKGAKSIDSKGRGGIGSVDRGRIDHPTQDDNARGESKTETGQIKRRQVNTDGPGIKQGRRPLQVWNQPNQNQGQTQPKPQQQYRQPEQTGPRTQPQVRQPQRKQPQVRQPQRQQPQVQQPQVQQPRKRPQIRQKPQQQSQPPQQQRPQQQTQRQETKQPKSPQKSGKQTSNQKGKNRDKNPPPR